MRASSMERYRSFVKVLCCMTVLLVTTNICDLKVWCPSFWTTVPTMATTTTTRLPYRSTSSFTAKEEPSKSKKQSSRLHGATLDLSVEGDDEGMWGKCVAVRVKGHPGTLTLEEAMTLVVLKSQSQQPQQPPLQVGLIFLDKPDGFISSGKVIDHAGVFHLYHYLEFLLVAYQQVHELLRTEQQNQQRETLANTTKTTPETTTTSSSVPLLLSSPKSPIQVPWIYVPLMQAPQEVCGVANGINCQIADLLLQNPTWYGMESNSAALKDFHPAYHGQHEKRQWDEESFPLDQEQHYSAMQETADIALIVSLRRRDRCNKAGRDQHGWNDYAAVFPVDDWHASLVSQLQSIPLPSELPSSSSSRSSSQPEDEDSMTTSLAAFFAAEKKKEDLIVCYVDRQATSRRMPDSEHDWLVQYLQTHQSIRFWHLLMQNYDGIHQLRIASECDVMIGVHGNGLSHVLWMAPRRYVVELHWDDKLRQGGYQPLAETMNHTYMALRQGLLVLDPTSINPAKHVQQPTTNEDPYKNGRNLIVKFLDRALSEQGVARSSPLPSRSIRSSAAETRDGSLAETPGKLHHHSEPAERTSAKEVPKQHSTTSQKESSSSTSHHRTVVSQVDDWGDTHPRHCHSKVKHIHLAVGQDPQREMTVSFASRWSGGERRPLVVAGVRYGTRPDQLKLFQPQDELPLTYNTTYPKESRNPSTGTDNDLYFSPYQHHITIRNLEPGMTYYYIPVIGNRHDEEDSLENDLFALASKTWKDHPTQHLENYMRNGLGKLVYDESSLQSRRRRRLAPKPYNGLLKSCPEPNRIRSFTTAPPLKKDYHQNEDDDEPMVRFGIVGDLGQFTHSQETLDHMFHNSDSMDAVLLVGDIAYTNHDHRRWDTFFDFLDDYPIFHSTPLQIATGNHDVEKAIGRNEIFQAYENRFRMPRVRPAKLGTLDVGDDLDMNEPPYPLPYEWGNAYYSFEYGPAKHIVVSAYSSMEPGSTQYHWLVGELQSIDREQTPWVLLTMHVPIYNTFKAHHRDLQIVAAQTHLEPLLVQYSVNVVFSGHIHAYQRTKTVAFGEELPTGPLHLTVGASGRQCCLTPFKSETPEPWIAARDGAHFGYGQFAIYNRTHAEWQWIPTSSSSLEPEQERDLPPRDSVVLENQYFYSNVARI